MIVDRITNKEADLDEKVSISVSWTGFTSRWDGA